MSPLSLSTDDLLTPVLTFYTWGHLVDLSKDLRYLLQRSSRRVHIFIQASKGIFFGSWTITFLDLPLNLESISERLMSSETLEDLRMLSKPVKYREI